MTTTTSVPSPLTSTNVTKDDNIWKRDSPISDSRSNRGFTRLCSPPLKHITIQSTQELLENFDPLDVLDSASERSVSSADTMITMTTEEERKNSQHIRNSYLHYESSKAQLHSSFPASPSPSSFSSSSFPETIITGGGNKRSQQSNQINPLSPTLNGDLVKSPLVGEYRRRKNFPNNVIAPCRPLVASADRQFNSDITSPLDDGYSTDSHSNTSPSTSSPLSSSFSSLSTFEGSFNSIQATVNPSGLSSSHTHTSVPSGNMQRNNMIIKGHNSSGSGRNGGQRPVVLPPKRRDQPIEIKDTACLNLEDRLRALTTIEEEEFGLVHSGGISDKMALGRYPISNYNSQTDPRRGSNGSSLSRDHQHKIVSDNKYSYRNDDNEHSSTGFFRAVPVEIVASPSSSENQNTFAMDESSRSSAGYSIHSDASNGPLPLAGYSTHSDAPYTIPPLLSPAHTGKGKNGWDDYTRFFEKNSDIPVHNIASMGHGKFQNSYGPGDLPDKDINKQIVAGALATHPKRPDYDSRTLVQHQDISELSGKLLSGESIPHNYPINSRSTEHGRQSRQMDNPMTLDCNDDSSQIPMSMPELNRQHILRRSLSSNSPLPISSSQDVYPSTESLSNYDKRYRNYGSHSPQQQHSLQQQQHQQQYQQQHQLYQQQPHQQQQHQQQWHQQHNQQPNTEIPNQIEPPLHLNDVQHEYLQSQYQPPRRRTSQDEFLSLSRSLSKQYEQQKEMLQQQQQQQQQQQEQHHHQYQQQHQFLQHQQKQHHQQYQHLSLHPENQFNSLPKSSSNPSYSPSYPEVVLRNPNFSSSTRSPSNPQDRYSWQPSSHHQEHFDDLLNSDTNSRASLDLGSIPQLQRQIRATSEMCLQMSKKHKFASSADIYKLFQGQRKPQNNPSSGTPHDFHYGNNNNNNNNNNTNNNSSNNSNNNTNIGRAHFHRHSFHSAPKSLWTGSQPALNIQSNSDEPMRSLRTGRHSIRIPSPATTSQGVSNSGPLRVDHSIVVPSDWTNVPPQIPSLSVADTDIILFQRQSSGYSSENELQQIESNAKATRKSKVRDERLVIMNPEQEFRPVDPSLDGGSSTGVDDEGSNTDNDPVYVNQRMIASNSVMASLGKPPSALSTSKSDTPSPLPPRQTHTHHKNSPLNSQLEHHHHHKHHQSSNQHNRLQFQQQHLQQQQQQQQYTQIPSQSTKASTVKTIVQSGNIPFLEEKKITQKQVINLNNKSVTIRSYIPSQSYSPVNRNTDEAKISSLSLAKQVTSGGVSPLHLQTDPEMPIDIPNAQNHDPTQLGQSSLSLKKGSNCYPQLSPVDIAQKLEVPFSTNIISDENGDRLSTLV